jgi:hypothetical protein
MEKGEDVSIQLVFPTSGKAAIILSDSKITQVSIQLVFPTSGKERRLEFRLGLASRGTFREPQNYLHFSRSYCH